MSTCVFPVTRALARAHGERLDKLLPAVCPSLSRRAWRAVIEAPGAVAIDKDATRVLSRRVAPGALVKLKLGALDEPTAGAIKAGLAASPWVLDAGALTRGVHFLHADKKIAFVNKPGNVLCQSAEDRAAREARGAGRKPAAPSSPGGSGAAGAAAARDERKKKEAAAAAASAAAEQPSQPPSDPTVIELSHEELVAADPDDVSSGAESSDPPSLSSLPLDERVPAALAVREGAGPPFCHMYHRIDRAASGLVMFIRSRSLLPHIDAAWDDGTIQRSYLAVVWGHPAWRVKTALGPIGRLSKSAWKFGVVADGGKPARTELRVLGTGTARLRVPAAAGAHPGRDGVSASSGALLSRDALLHSLSSLPLPVKEVPFSIVQATLQTGRTHQIRVHLADAGHPILGDALYDGLPLQVYPESYSPGPLVGGLTAAAANANARGLAASIPCAPSSAFYKPVEGGAEADVFPGLAAELPPPAAAAAVPDASPSSPFIHRILLHSHRCVFSSEVRHIRSRVSAPPPPDLAWFLERASPVGEGGNAGESNYV